MKTIIVDDEKWMLKRFDIECKDIPDIQLIGSFRSPLAALEFAKQQRVELAFLDIEMPEMTGLQLAGQLRAIHPGIVVIFVSAYEKYMAEAFRSQLADYYIMKPYNNTDIENAVERARLLSGRLRKSVSIHTFGNFELSVDGTPIAFSDEKTKELLALIVNERGNVLHVKKACNALWPDQELNTNSILKCRKLLKQLQTILKQNKLESLITQKEDGVMLLTDIVDCDLFAYLDGDLKAMRRFEGVYLPAYAWSKKEQEHLCRQSTLLNQYQESVARNTLCACVHFKTDEMLHITYANEAFLAITGYSRDELLNQTQNSLRTLILREDYIRLLQTATKKGFATAFIDAEFRLICSNREEVWVLCKCTPTPVADEIECMLIDITGMKSEQYRLEQEAQNDPLTGLLNRMAAQRRIETYLTECENHTSAMILMDVDHFKNVNDTYGHPFADTVLTDIAAILKRSFRSSDILCRLGGDEMMLFLKDVGTAEKVTMKLDEVRMNLRSRLQAKTKEKEISCSFGLAMYPQNATTYETLYQCADRALYQAKEERDTMICYSDIRVQEELAEPMMEIAVKNAVINNSDQLSQKISIERFQNCSDIPTEINRVLAMIGKHYDVSRVYIFELSEDGKYAVNTFEWCAAQVTAEIANLQQLPADSLTPYYQELFDNDGQFYCYDIRSLSAELYRIVEPQGIKSMLQYLLQYNNQMLGMIGFDECRTNRYFNSRQIQILAECAELLGTVLYQYRKKNGSTYQALTKEIHLDKESGGE